MKCFIDSDILIWHLRGNTEAMFLLETLIADEDSELSIGVMQRAEIVFFMHEKDKTGTLDFLSLFKTHPVNQAIIDLAGRYFRKWHPSHGIDPNDAILASTVALYGGCIYTQNMAHYPMNDVIVHQGWK